VQPWLGEHVGERSRRQQELDALRSSFPKMILEFAAKREDNGSAKLLI
jgi:hypothetical protein